MTRGRVLLVDADCALRAMIEEHLRSEGWDVETRDEARDAMDRAGLGRFDVLVAVASPRGRLPARLLEALTPLRPRPAVVLVEDSSEGERSAQVPARTDLDVDVLPLPLSRAAVGDAVRRAARRRHAELCRQMAPPKAPSGGLGGLRGRRRARSQPARRVGRFEVSDQMGIGPTGHTYRCHDPTSGRTLAVKLVPRETLERLGRGARWLDRFRRAAGATASVGHPGLAGLVDYGYDEELGCAYLASEHVEGRSLAAMLEGGRPLPAPLAVRVAFRVGDALAAAHEARLVHRRLAPSAVVVDESGEPRVTDLAVAGALAWDLLPLVARPGGPGLAAPEQLRGGPVDGRADQFALGAVLHEMLTGRPRFDRVAAGRSRVEAPAPAESGVEASAALEATVARMVARAARDRFPTDGELLDALAERGAELGLELERLSSSSGLL